MVLKQEKQHIRKLIAEMKKRFSTKELQMQSEEILMVLEATDTFCKAKNILIYHSLADEVDTDILFHKYKDKKNFYLPVVTDNDKLEVKRYTNNTKFKEAAYGILEPIGDTVTDLRNIDLVIIPAIAFDYNLNRLGRGKGYYDRFLKTIKAPRVGLAFEFQVLENIPHQDHDIPMDMVVTENEIICNGIY